MCRTDFDEGWEVFDSWWGTGRCVDCGYVGRALYEELGPESAPFDAYFDLYLNDGVPDWSEKSEDAAELWADDARYEAARPHVTDTQAICENCLEARRWLQVWCRTWLYGEYRADIIEHWEEDEVTHSLTFGRLVIAAISRWAPLRRRRLTQPEVAALVDASLDRLRAETGLTHAPW